MRVLQGTFSTIPLCVERPRRLVIVVGVSVLPRRSMCQRQPQPSVRAVVAGDGRAMSRSTEQRKSDALAKLTANDSNVWVATASSTGAVHLVPVTHTWNGSQIVVATEPTSVTVANATSNRRVSLALGETRDVVMIDAVLVRSTPKADAPASLADAYAAQAGWDPRTDRDDYVFLVFEPERIQVWREGEDLAGRTVMRDGAWVT